MSSKLSAAVGKKWLAFVMILIGIALVCLFQPLLTEYAITAGIILGCFYLTWQGVVDIVEKHYEFKIRELELRGKANAPKIT